MKLSDITFPLVRRDPDRRVTLPVRTILAVLPVLIAAALIQKFVVLTNPDVSWLLTVGERIAHGETLYGHILETNPPMSVWLYRPALAATIVFGASPEAWTVAFVLLVATLVAFMAKTITRRAGLGADDGVPSLVASLLALTVLPFSAFAEREHIALVALWPLFACLVARAEGTRATDGEILVAGLLGAVGVAVKPHFALAVALPVLVLAWRERDWRWLFRSEVMIAAAGSAALFAVSLAAHPEYLSDMLPLVAETYRPVRMGLVGLVVQPAFLAFALMAVGIALGAGAQAGRAGFLIPLAAAVGFALGYVEQGKGWAYHLLPALGLLAATTVTSAPGALARALGDRLPAAAFGALAAIGGLMLSAAALKTDDDEIRRLAAIVETVGPKPRIGLVSAEIAVGHPLARMVGGHLVGSVCSLWMSGGAIRLGFDESLDDARRARLERIQAAERRRIAAEWTAEPPDVVLIEQGYDWLGWTLKEPALAAIVGRYREIGATENVRVMAREPAKP